MATWYDNYHFIILSSHSINTWSTKKTTVRVNYTNNNYVQYTKTLEQYKWATTRSNIRVWSIGISFLILFGFYQLNTFAHNIVMYTNI